MYRPRPARMSALRLPQPGPSTAGQGDFRHSFRHQALRCVHQGDHLLDGARVVHQTGFLEAVLGVVARVALVCGE